ncbi:hypothetical protein PG999_014564 [Apiospora kogelbergensis]|uniref:SMP-30/Gluconolactonase/LRE-like region domain-containing protein n=1 Tax=Apiospora kogelbergensis TaxID=1337665 RepID=A0AAW0Q3P4_9PEZI
MGSFSTFSLGVFAVVLATLYQTNVHFVLYTGVRLFLGIGHTLEPLSAFPYKCRRIEDERLQACEDMWLSEATRQLFLACSESKGRQQWSPNGGKYNASGRSLTDHITVLDIDEPVGSGFNIRVLGTPGYPGTHGNGRLHLVGMSGHDDDDGETRLWLIDVKPSVDLATGRVLDDQSAVGANQTVEVFRTTGGRKATSLEHLESFWAPSLIKTPNRVAAVGDGTNAFWVTNDLGHSESHLKSNSPINNSFHIETQGSVMHCSSSSSSSNNNVHAQNCAAVIPTGLSWPNGLVHNPHDGLLYVPSSMLGTVDIYNMTAAAAATKVDTVDVGYSIDNLMVDKDGDVWAAVFPVPKDLRAAFEDPHYGAHKGTATAAMRIRKKSRADDGNETGGSGYVIDKVLEDGFGEVLPVSTSVVHDATTGRLFFSSESFFLSRSPSVLTNATTKNEDKAST